VIALVAGVGVEAALGIDAACGPSGLLSVLPRHQRFNI